MGDMIIQNNETAVTYALVNAHDAFDLLAEECDILAGYVSCSDCRIHITECPVPAVELQCKVDSDHWDTFDIVSTNPKDIELYKAYVAPPARRLKMFVCPLRHKSFERINPMANVKRFTNTNFKRMQKRVKAVKYIGGHGYARMHASTIREIHARQERQEKERQRVLHDMIRF